MSAIAETTGPAVRSFARPDFARLVRIELRKSIDTPAGLWLMVATVVLTVVAAVARAGTGDVADRGFQSVLEIAAAPTNVVLPIIGILLITSEWSQKTALTTFTQMPDRMRLVAAKAAAGVSLGFVFFAFAVIATAASVALLGTDGPDRWSFGAEMWLQYAAYVTLGMMFGFALGAMLLASAPAIVVYFAAPTVITLLASFSAIEPALKWIDPANTSEPLTVGPLASGDVPELITATIAWVVVPLAIGCWRISRAEIG